MRLEDWFEFEKFDTKFGPVERIRIKGHRIGIEIVIQDYNEGQSVEQIQSNYPTLTREEIEVTIAYYLKNKTGVDNYICEGEKIADAYYQEHLQREPDVVTRKLRKLIAEREQKEAAAG